MKKLLVVLLALTALSVAAFADDVAWTWGLTVKTGAAITLGDSTSHPNASIVLNDADDPTLSRVRFDAEAALGDFSAHARINSDLAGATPVALVVAPLFPNWWVNAYFLDKMVQLQVGALDHTVTDTAYNGWGGISGNGLQVVVTPISGLSAGIFLPVSGTDTPIDTEWAGLKVGAVYAMPNLLTAKFTFMNAGGTNANDLAFGVDVTAVANLTAQLEGQVIDLSNSTTGEMDFTEYFAYAMGALKPSIELDQSIYSVSGSNAKLTFKPAVDYEVMTGLNAGASFKYVMNSNGNVGGTQSGVNVDPYVKFTFNDKAKLKVDANYGIPNLSATSTWSLVTNFNFMFSY